MTVIAVLSSAVLSIIGATLITSLIWYCGVVKKKKKYQLSRQESSTSQLKEISLDENTAYGQVTVESIYEDIPH